MDNLIIYKNGQYDKSATVKLKLSLIVDQYKKRAAVKLDEIDYYFVNHQKLIR